MKKYLKGLIHGLLIGFAFISAMGGGTLAVILGIYDDLVAAVSSLRTSFKKSVKYLAPILVGAIIGIVALFWPIGQFLEFQPFISTSLFVGLTLGGLIVFRELTKGQFKPIHILLVILGIGLVAVFGVLSWFAPELNLGTNQTLNLSALEIFLLFIIGFFASSALIAPGISGTMFLISIGYYNKLLLLIKTFLTFSGTDWGVSFGLLAAFGIGFIVGFFAISKLMDFLLKRFRTSTNFTILGLIIGQIIISYFNGEMRPAYGLVQNPVLEIFLSILMLIIGVVLSLVLLKLANKKKRLSSGGDHDEA